VAARVSAELSSHSNQVEDERSNLNNRKLNDKSRTTQQQQNSSKTTSQIRVYIQKFLKAATPTGDSQEQGQSKIEKVSQKHETRDH
jgi:hypothetical protein